MDCEEVRPINEDFSKRIGRIPHGRDMTEEEVSELRPDLLDLLARYEELVAPQ